MARRIRQEAIAAEGGEEADGSTTGKPATEGERLDTGNAWDHRARKERLTMSKDASEGFDASHCSTALIVYQRPSDFTAIEQAIWDHGGRSSVAGAPSSLDKR